MRRPSRPDLLALLRSLQCPTRASALRATLDGALVTMTLRRRGVRELLSVTAGQGTVDPDRAKAVSEAVDIGLGVLPVAATCLRRSVTLQRELHRLGLASELHVGVRRGPRAMEAHAWVQVGPVVVNDDPAVTATYAALAAGDLERITATLR